MFETNNPPASIYLIDDEPLDNMIFKMMIKRVNKSLNVDTIANGKNAIKKLHVLSETNPALLPDFIFLDINMPFMNGWEFLKEYGRLKIDQIKKTHIFIVSSSIDQEDFSRSYANPLIENFLTKPLTLEKLKKIFLTA